MVHQLVLTGSMKSVQQLLMMLLGSSMVTTMVLSWLALQSVTTEMAWTLTVLPEAPGFGPMFPEAVVMMCQQQRVLMTVGLVVAVMFLPCSGYEHSVAPQFPLRAKVLVTMEISTILQGSAKPVRQQLLVVVDLPAREQQQQQQRRACDEANRPWYIQSN